MEHNYLSIKEWAVEDRPREKLQLKGASALSDAELLAIIIGTGTKNETAVDIAKRIMHVAKHNLFELSGFTLHDFRKIRGIGQAKAITIYAALELGKRQRVSEIQKQNHIRCSKDVFDSLSPQLSHLSHEEFHVLFLNRAHAVILQHKMSSGGVVGTVIDIKMVVKLAVEQLASAVILVHNHPSGNVQPSAADRDITTKLTKALAFFECHVYDHIIISKQTYYSFADEGIL